MRRRSKIVRVIFCLVVPFFAALAAFAAEEGGSPANQPIGTTFKWIHFVILAGLAYWLFSKVLPPVFKRNAENISAAINKATASKAEADRRLNEAVAKLASLEKEVAQFRAEGLREAAAEAERLRNSTRLEMEKIGAAAKSEIQAAERAARLELKAIAATLAVDDAESLVAKQMTPAVQDALINNFVQTLGRPN
jgi:F0F1-type ATP synthase membrane subunit b/b'